MVERMAEGALTVDERAGRVLFCNPAFARMLGLPADRVIGRPLRAFLVHADADRASELATVEHEHRGDYALLGSDGRRVPVAISSAPVDTPGGRARCLVVSDLTTRRDVEQLREAQARLEVEARRKDEFIAVLGHELRNPLAPILHAAELLGGDEPGSDAIRRARTTIVRQVAHLSRLVDDLLDLRRITQGTFELLRERVDLREAVSAGIEATQPLVDQRRHVLEVAMPGEPVMADADCVRIAQVVSNLLHNAAKFTPERGRLRLSLRAFHDHAEVVMEDDGPGIDGEALATIFEPFVQGQASTGIGEAPVSSGLGVGLTLVRRIVDLHGGDVVAETLARGCRFRVRLPLEEDTPRRRPLGPGRGDTLRLVATPEPQRDTRPAPRRVLVCDDNADVAEMTALLLRSRGHVVEVAGTGAEALRLAPLLAPDVVLLDIGLPDMDGYEVARELRRQPSTRACVLAAVSGYGRDCDRAAARDAGFDHHLTKPVGIAQLERILSASEGS
jgi:two-component system CheB/CheR fusion protein